MPIYQIILDYLKVLIWPLIVFLTILLLRGELKDLFKRLVKVSYKDLELSLPNQRPPESTIPKEVQEEIKDTIEEKKKENEEKAVSSNLNMEQTKQQISALLTQVATLQTVVQFEKIHNGIFASQVAMLRSMRSNIEGLWHVALNAWYEEARAKDSFLKNYPFSDYIGYLLNTGLARTIETENGRKYLITDLGTDFLSYVEKSGYSNFSEH